MSHDRDSTNANFPSLFRDLDFFLKFRQKYHYWHYRKYYSEGDTDGWLWKVLEKLFENSVWKTTAFLYLQCKGKSSVSGCEPRWTIPNSLSDGFSRQKYWVEQPFPARDLPDGSLRPRRGRPCHLNHQRRMEWQWANLIARIMIIEKFQHFERARDKKFDLGRWFWPQNIAIKQKRDDDLSLLSHSLYCIVFEDDRGNSVLSLNSYLLKYLFVMPHFFSTPALLRNIGRVKVRGLRGTCETKANMQ